MDFTIRLEKEIDYRDTEKITRDAFWDVYRPGSVEHLIVHKLRASDAFVKELDYVACHNSNIIGNIMYSKAKVINSEERTFEVLCLGPICVTPIFQNNGIGSKMIMETIRRAQELKYKGIFLMGKPRYYSRFGFRNAEIFNIQTSEGENADYFMGLELSKKSLQGITGKYFEDTVFQIQERELIMFDKKFPYREKHITETQIFR